REKEALMFYPLFIELRHRRVLVVGGGVVAERKVATLLQAEADVTVVAPEIGPGLEKLEASGAIRTARREFEEADLDGALLVVSATDDPDTQERVAVLARAQRILVNTVDQPRLCDFIVPAIVRRGDVVAAISTSGKSPSLAATLKERVEGVITNDVARAAHLLGAFRSEVHARFADPARRKEAFERIVESRILDWISELDDEAVLARMRGIIGGIVEGLE
ncbi:MAG TPA: bifunctional precorrin-2 dehydrogenase/sirohydrochlorin ferrochelatase, partial [Terriglobia bacterium]|nr:bifunctional precorrin-2 dehydrogenase/sirohydrochlorin ferrochelatase [Terriglobia bacterium]